MTGLEILYSCLYDERETETSGEAVRVHLELARENSQQELLSIQCGDCVEFSQSEAGPGQHLRHVGYEELNVGVRVDLAGQ